MVNSTFLKPKPFPVGRRRIKINGNNLIGKWNNNQTLQILGQDWKK